MTIAEMADVVLRQLQTAPAGDPLSVTALHIAGNLAQHIALDAPLPEERLFDAVSGAGKVVVTYWEHDRPGVAAALRSWAARHGHRVDERDHDGIGTHYEVRFGGSYLHAISVYVRREGDAS
jgi:hypothetical protein